MFHFLKILVVISIILLASWYFAADHLPSSVTKSDIGKKLNKVVGSIAKDVGGISEKLRPGNYYDKIRIVRAESYKGVIQEGIQKNAVMLIYVYSLEGQISHVNFAHIVRIAREKADTDLKVLALAIEEDKEKLAKFLNKFGNNLGFIPLQLDPADALTFPSSINGVLTGYVRPPYLIITNRNGVAIAIPPGLTKETKIRKAVDSALVK